MKFKMTHMFGHSIEYDEITAPKWLKESTENKWFWNGHVMTLKVGETVETDFQTIERIE